MIEFGNQTHQNVLYSIAEPIAEQYNWSLYSCRWCHDNLAIMVKKEHRIGQQPGLEGHISASRFRV